MKIFDMRLRPPFKSIAEGMFQNSGRELFEPEVFAPRFGMRIAESAKRRSMELCIQEMDEAGICAGAVLIRKSTAMKNEDLEELTRLYPKRFVGIAGIDPHEGKAALDEIDTFVHKGVCRGVLFETGFCRPPLYADDKVLSVFYEKCEAENIPVFISFGGFVAPDLSYTDPMIVERIALAFPKLKLIVAHGGWPYVSAICHVAFNREHVYLAPDLYTMNVPGNREYLDAANYLIPEKFMFGTAYPCVDMRQAAAYYKQWGLRAEVMQAVMFDNAVRVLNLSDKDIAFS